MSPNGYNVVFSSKLAMSASVQGESHSGAQGEGWLSAGYSDQGDGAVFDG